MFIKRTAKTEWHGEPGKPKLPGKNRVDWLVDTRPNWIPESLEDYRPQPQFGLRKIFLLTFLVAVGIAFLPPVWDFCWDNASGAWEWFWAAKFYVLVAVLFLWAIVRTPKPAK
jgi:hypothetical protein